MISGSDGTYFLYAFLFNVGLATCILVLFSLLHRCAFFQRLTMSREFLGEDCPKKPTGGAFSWILPVLRATEDQIIKTSGLDAAVYLRMFLFSIQLFGIYSLLGLIILVPVNVAGVGVEDTGPAAIEKGSLDNLSTTNVGQESRLLWAHFVVIYIITGIACYLLWVTYRHVFTLRHRFMARRAAQLQWEQYTLIATDIPYSVPKDKASQKERTEAFSRHVSSYFSRLYSHAFLACQTVTRYAKVQAVYKRRKSALVMLARTQWKIQKAAQKDKTRDKEQRPLLRLGFCGLWGPKVDAEEYWRGQVRVLSRQLAAEQAVAKERRVTKSAFVAFKQRGVATVASQTRHALDGASWQVLQAPEPQDVYWPNVELRTWEKMLRRHAVRLIVLLIVLFFYAPITFIAALTTMQNLTKTWPWLARFENNSVWNSFITTFLPSVVLKIFLWVVPSIMLLLSYFEGCLSHSEAERHATAKHYYVQIFDAFLGYVFAGSLFSNLEAILNHPKDLFAILAKSIPQTSTFFITYIITSSLTLGLELLRLPIPLIYYVLKILFVGWDNANREGAWHPGGCIYYYFVPYQLLVVTLGVVFATIAPVILPFALLYSCLAYLTWKHQVMYVYQRPYNTGGMMWGQFVAGVFWALLLAQGTMIGLFLLKGAYMQASYCIPLLIGTIYFRIVLHKRNYHSFRTLPLEVAANVDRYTRKRKWQLKATDFEGLYVPACMRPVKTELDDSAPPLGGGHHLARSVSLPTNGNIRHGQFRGVPQRELVVVQDGNVSPGGVVIGDDSGGEEAEKLVTEQDVSRITEGAKAHSVGKSNRPSISEDVETGSGQGVGNSSGDSPVGKGNTKRSKRQLLKRTEKAFLKYMCLTYVDSGLTGHFVERRGEVGLGGEEGPKAGVALSPYSGAPRPGRGVSFEARKALLGGEDGVVKNGLSRQGSACRVEGSMGGVEEVDSNVTSHGIKLEFDDNEEGVVVHEVSTGSSPPLKSKVRSDGQGKSGDPQSGSPSTWSDASREKDEKSDQGLVAGQSVGQAGNSSIQCIEEERRRWSSTSENESEGLFVGSEPSSPAESKQVTGRKGISSPTKSSHK